MAEGTARERTVSKAEAEVEPAGGGNAMTAIAALPRLLGGALEDVRTIARGMSVLPELARTLASIQRSAEHMDDEVTKMREAVESMGGDVEALHPKLEEVKDSIPLRRRRRA